MAVLALLGLLLGFTLQSSLSRLIEAPPTDRAGSKYDRHGLRVVGWIRLVNRFRDCLEARHCR